MDRTRLENAAWRSILWIAAPLYIASLAYLMLLGNVMLSLLWVASGLYQLGLALLARRITKPQPPEEARAAPPRGLLWAQIAVLAAIILLTGWQSDRIPLWSAMDAALQTRLRRLLSLPWTLFIQALIFGVWHIVSNTRSMGGNVPAGLAVCIVMQAVLGFVFGYVFHRTKNLAAPSLIHVATNVLGQMLG